MLAIKKHILIIILSFFVTVLSFNKIFSQQTGNIPVHELLMKPISIDIDSLTLEETLSVIEKAAEFYFNYNVSIIPTDKKISVHIVNEPAADVVKKILKY